MIIKSTILGLLVFGMLSVGSMISFPGLSIAPLPPITITTEAYAHDFSFDEDLVVGDVLDKIGVNDKEQVQGVPLDKEPAGEEDDDPVFCFFARAFSLAFQWFCFEDVDDCQFGQGIAERSQTVLMRCQDNEFETLPPTTLCSVDPRGMGFVNCPPAS